MTNSPKFTLVRVALITGGAQGIGRAIALRLAADGLDVAVDDVPSKLPLLEEVISEVQKLGRKAIPLTYDVSKEEDVRAMVDKTVTDLGRLDVMVANAGIGGGHTPIVEADIAHWESVWAVNIRGPLFCYKYAGKQMIKQGQGGRIIGASSICGKQGLGAYCASKAMVRSLTQTASLELAEHGITVNAYAPGIIETAMTTRSNDAALGGPCTVVKRVMQIPDAKVGQVDVVAGLVSYLVDPGSHSITGQTISIDGGVRFD